MKYLYVLFIFLFVSCLGPFGFNKMDYEILQTDLDIAWKQTASFEYQENESGWKSPFEFENDGGGNYNDFAVYLIYLLGPDSAYASVFCSDNLWRTFVAYGGYFICAHEYGKQYVIPDNVLSVSQSYEDVMKIATDNGTRNVKNTVQNIGGH